VVGVAVNVPVNVAVRVLGRATCPVQIAEPDGAADQKRHDAARPGTGSGEHGGGRGGQHGEAEQCARPEGGAREQSDGGSEAGYDADHDDAERDLVEMPEDPDRELLDRARRQVDRDRAQRVERCRGGGEEGEPGRHVRQQLRDREGQPRGDDADHGRPPPTDAARSIWPARSVDRREGFVNAHLDRPLDRPPPDTGSRTDSGAGGSGAAHGTPGRRAGVLGR
jgi:hypothetical protein